MRYGMTGIITNNHKPLSVNLSGRDCRNLNDWNEIQRFRLSVCVVSLLKLPLQRPNNVPRTKVDVEGCDDEHVLMMVNSLIRTFSSFNSAFMHKSRHADKTVLSLSLSVSVCQKLKFLLSFQQTSQTKDLKLPQVSKESESCWFTLKLIDSYW